MFWAPAAERPWLTSSAAAKSFQCRRLRSENRQSSSGTPSISSLRVVLIRDSLVTLVRRLRGWRAVQVSA